MVTSRRSRTFGPSGLGPWSASSTTLVTTSCQPRDSSSGSHPSCCRLRLAMPASSLGLMAASSKKATVGARHWSSPRWQQDASRRRSLSGRPTAEDRDRWPGPRGGTRPPDGNPGRTGRRAIHSAMYRARPSSVSTLTPNLDDSRKPCTRRHIWPEPLSAAPRGPRTARHTSGGRPSTPSGRGRSRSSDERHGVSWRVPLSSAHRA